MGSNTPACHLFTVPIPLDCAGSLMPIPHVRAGDGVHCPVCDKKVYLTAPPPQGLKDPWNGDSRARVQPHWVKVPKAPGDD